MEGFSLAKNIQEVRQRIRISAMKNGRNLEDVKLIAVSKTVDAEMIKLALKENILDFGENKVQEMTKKADILTESVNWHFIGRLQTNKVKYLIGNVGLIHSLDRYELAQEIQRKSEQVDSVTNVLVQVNVAEEKTKAGVLCEQVSEFVREISLFKNIKINGLMTIAPYTDNAEELRPYFRKLYKIHIDIKQKSIDNISMKYLSMGMSNDFHVAIEEGANMVRVGTAIFGERDYSQR